MKQRGVFLAENSFLCRFTFFFIARLTYLGPHFYLQVVLRVVLVVGTFLVVGAFVVGNFFPGANVSLVVGNLVGLDDKTGVDGPFVFKDVDFAFKEKIQHEKQGLSFGIIFIIEYYPSQQIPFFAKQKTSQLSYLSFFLQHEN